MGDIADMVGRMERGEKDRLTGFSFLVCLVVFYIPRA